ncbi:MAG: hypothetical protein FJW20_09695 [Acidimicrobiia bacterium]|nr:hypothetical protein [Acidimicrobiia bacterium]
MAGILFLAIHPAPARQEFQTCGTHADKLKEELALHRMSMRDARLRPEARTAQPAPSANRDIGGIAIIEDADGVVARRNQFNLDRKTIEFTPGNAQASQYRFTVVDAGWDGAAATAGTPIAGLDDDDSREMELPFSFPFFGRTYTKMFVNSDGNITFGRGDNAISERSLGRMTAGAPRISGLFRDLDPSMTPTGVRVLSESGRLVVNWVNVPEYVPFGFGPPNTFQIRMYPNGRIEFSYQGISSNSAVVGIAPGNLEGSSSVVSFSAGSNLHFTGALAERFAGAEEVDIVLAAQKFYETHDDAYDYLVIYNNLGISASPGAVAFEVTVRSDRLGIGDTLVDSGKEFGSPRRLQAVLNLGPISQYPRDPDAVVPSRALSGDTPLTILGHEAGHLFLAFASVRDPNNPNSRPMLGRQTAHWSFTFNSDASLLEGNRIRDNGAGATPRFTTTATVEAFSALDQYLMGLRAPEEVGPTFVVTEATTGSSNRPPQAGVSFDGNRRDIQIQELLQAEGRRTPDHTVAQRRFRFAFLLVTARGVEPLPEELSQLETYRQRFEQFFHTATSQRATAQTVMQRDVRFSMAPAAGILANRDITATVAVATPPEAPLTLILRRQNGVTEAPASVVIPAGQRQASFTIRGIRSGVEEFTVEPSGNRYFSAHARIQVLADFSRLRLEVLAGDKQRAVSGSPLPEAVEARVVDHNNLPYPGLELSARVTAGGAVQPITALTNEDGKARFVWTPGPGQLHDMQLFLTSQPSLGAGVTALGQPALAASGVVNAASFSAGLSPGSLATLFGLNLAGGATASSLPPWQEQLGRVEVLMNNLPARLLFVSDRQINLQAPAGLATGAVELIVRIGSGATRQQTTPIQALVRPFDPGIFVSDATQLGAVLVAGTGQLTSIRPASAGDVVEIYCTGLGALRPSEVIPGLLETILRPQVLIGGQTAEVQFSGQAPGIPGLYQVNARVPAGLAGRQPLILQAEGASSNTVQIVLR